MIWDFNHIIALGFLIFFGLVLIRMTYRLFFTDSIEKSAEAYYCSRFVGYVVTGKPDK